MDSISKQESKVLRIHLPFGNYTEETKRLYTKHRKRAVRYFLKKRIINFFKNIFN